MDLFIYGAGATGREIADIVARSQAIHQTWSGVHFVDDCTSETSVYGLQVFKFDAMRQFGRPYQCIVAQGEPHARQSLHQKLVEHGVALATVVDPRTTISPAAHIEPGCIIGPGSFVSCNTRIAANTMLEINCIVGHDIDIGAHSVISSCTVIGGHSTVGQATFIGMNASVRDRIKIGSRSIIGMASAVFSNIPDDVIALGNPARVLRNNDEHRVFKSIHSTKENT